MEQAWTPEDWQDYLGRELGRSVRVVYGRSRTVPVQARPLRCEGPLSEEVGGLELRLHAMFAQAPPRVRAALARWLAVGRRARRASRELDEWLDQALAALPPPARRLARAEPRGLVYDLRHLAEPLWRDPFAEDFVSIPRPTLTWGRRGRSSSRRSLRLGSYDPRGHRVRLHPVLDQEAVPVWFVRFVLMHELLHAALPPKAGPGGRWIHHGPEFRRREAAYADHARALIWEQTNLPRLIQSARTGRPFRPAASSRVSRFPSSGKQR